MLKFFASNKNFSVTGLLNWFKVYDIYSQKDHRDASKVFYHTNETSFNETSFISALKNIQKFSHMMTKHEKNDANFY